MYAIIEDSGSQIKVSQGDIIRVALRELPADAATLTFERVLLVAPGGAMTTLELQADTAPQVLAAQARGLAPGAYRLRWQVLAVDGHVTRGDIPFTVVAP